MGDQNDTSALEGLAGLAQKKSGEYPGGQGTDQVPWGARH